MKYEERVRRVAMIYKYAFDNKPTDEWINYFREDCNKHKVKENDVLSVMFLAETVEEINKGI